MIQKKTAQTNGSRPARSSDRTKRKQAEEALRTSEATYRSIFNATNDGIIVLDIETGEIVDANATFCNVFGYAPDEARGLRVGDFSSGQPAYTQEDALRLIQKAVRGEPQRFEWLAKSRDGRLSWIDVTLKRATIAGQDRMLAIGRDITERKQAEEALRDAKQFSEGLLAAMRDGVSVLDSRGVHVYANTAFCEMTGFSREQLIGVGTPHPYWPPEKLEEIEGAFQKTAKAQFQDFELTFMRKNGQRFPVIVSPSYTKDQQGNVVHLFATVKDITERKQAEEALRQSEAKFRALAETAAASILIYRGTKPLYANAATETLTGYTREEILAREVWQFVHPDFQSLVRERSRARQQGEQAPPRYELKIVRKSGEERWVDFTAGMIEFEGQAAAIGTAYDITERKLAEEALRESEKRYRLLAENVTDVIWTTDMDLNYTYISPSRRLLGHAPGQPMPQRVEEALTPASLEITMKVLAEELAIENMDEKDLSRSRTLELENYRSDGSTVWVEDRMTFLRDPDGQAVGILGVTRDITERKQAEQALRESERRFHTLSDATFEGIAIHHRGTILEANQPLATMFGYELSEVIGMHALDFVGPESRDAVLQSILSKSREPFEFTGLRKDGTTFPVEVCGKPIPYQGKMVTVASLRDITEHKQAEEALQKARDELEARVEREMERGNPYGLTFRELTVLHVVAAGRADKEIGSQLGISTLTASKHLANILSKMGAASRTEACVRALREGLLD